jgi:hypothetical protein
VAELAGAVGKLLVGICVRCITPSRMHQCPRCDLLVQHGWFDNVISVAQIRLLFLGNIKHDM